MQLLFPRFGLAMKLKIPFLFSQKSSKIKEKQEQKLSSITIVTNRYRKQFFLVTTCYHKTLFSGYTAFHVAWLDHVATAEKRFMKFKV